MNQDNWGNHGTFMKALIDGLATPRMTKDDKKCVFLAFLLIWLLFLL